MKVPSEAQARDALLRVSHDLRAFALAQLDALLSRTRARVARIDAALPASVRVPAQRFGEKLWQRIALRFPALQALREPGVRGEAGVGAGADAGREPARSPHTQPETAQPAPDVPALLRALRDPSAEAAATAAIALGEAQAPELEATCQAALWEVLANADGYFHPLTRVAALRSVARKLASPPSPEQLEPVFAALRDRDAEVSIAAIYTVGERAPDAVAVERLLPILLDDTGFFLPIVRDAVTRTLERRGLLTGA